MPTDELQWYAIIDGAQDERLLALVKSCSQHICLFKGDIPPEAERVAPWLVRIDEREALVSTWQQHGRGKNWGLMLLSALPLERLQQHCRKFLQARLPDGTMVHFRYYDPRVFNTFIRAALPEDRKPWFDGVAQYAAESADGADLCQYRLKRGVLYDRHQPLE